MRDEYKAGFNEAIELTVKKLYALAGTEEDANAMLVELIQFLAKSQKTEIPPSAFSAFFDPTSRED